MRLSILYRGPLSSCNYDCPYCPFAKHYESREELATDRRALERFLDWVEAQTRYEIGVLFTPWGEALIRHWYQRALVRLTNMPHVWRAAIQTNLSCGLSWVEECDKDRLGLWATYHPGEVPRERFLAKCHELDRYRVRYSVGVVGLKENADEIEAIRRELSPETYLWVNAFKSEPEYYSDEDLMRLGRIDPLFQFNTIHHSSFGRPCRTGKSVISVDGDGTIRRCHFIKETLGNIYDHHLSDILRERPCTNLTCGCHIGYADMNDLGLYDVFGDNVLERVPLDLISGDHRTVPA